MKPAKLDLPIIWRGCDYGAITFQWKNFDGNPFDLTGWFPYASTTEFNLNAQITDPTNGLTTISLTNAMTTPLNMGDKPWSWVWAYLPSDVIFPPFLAGTVTVKQATSNVP